MTYDEAVDTLIQQIERAVRGRCLMVTAFPARRHDELGWCVGHIVGGHLLHKQINVFVPVESAGLADDYIARLLDAASTSGTLSAVLTRACGEQYQERRCQIGGLHLRFTRTANVEVRIDVLIGQPQQAMAQGDGAGV